MSALTAMEQFALAPDLIVCRVLNGMWQISGAHGRIDRENALASMGAHVDAGFTSWDLADHYGPAEDCPVRPSAVRLSRHPPRGASPLGADRFTRRRLPNGPGDPFEQRL